MDSLGVRFHGRKKKQNRLHHIPLKKAYFVQYETNVHIVRVCWRGEGGSVTKIMKPWINMHIPDKDASILRASMSVSAAF